MPCFVFFASNALMKVEREVFDQSLAQERIECMEALFTDIPQLVKGNSLATGTFEPLHLRLVIVDR